MDHLTPDQIDARLRGMPPRQPEPPRLRIRHFFWAIFTAGLIGLLIAFDPIGRLAACAPVAAVTQ